VRTIDMHIHHSCCFKNLGEKTKISCCHQLAPTSPMC